MSIESVKSDLDTAMENGWLATIHMHNRDLFEYAQIVDFKNGKTGPPTLRIQMHSLLSGGRLVPKGRKKTLVLSHISYATVHQDKPVPTPEA